jgi:hypothetical protein
MVLQDDFGNAYADLLPAIERCYRDAQYWHGTGRYHYRLQGSSRYDGTQAEIDDIFASILRNGLLPHRDTWIDFGLENNESISLGTVRMFSRLFALAHQYEHSSGPAFELGDMRFWVKLYSLLFLSLIASKAWVAGWFAITLIRPSSYANTREWIGAIHKKHINIWADILKGRSQGSDITGNYGILLGIRGLRDDVTSLPLPRSVEVRTNNRILAEDFTHVEVPLEHVAETRALLDTLNLSLEVLPIEFVDLYLSDRPVRELAYT